MFDDSDNALLQASLAVPHEDESPTVSATASAQVVIAIESAGSTTLSQFDDIYRLDGQFGVILRYGDGAVREGLFGGWRPVGAEAEAGGYQVAWQLGTTDQYTLWHIDSGGYYKSGNAIMSGSSYAWQSLEPTFQQDLNGDGTVGATSTVMEAVGSAILLHVADVYMVNGQTLKFSGVAVTEGQFGAWTPLGAAQSGEGYQVAWKFGSADQYTIWNLDIAGNYIPGNAITPGKTVAFESAETTFGQDLNGDGTIGIKTTVIEAAGAATLSQMADIYTVNGQILKYFGATIAEGQFGVWMPIGAAQSDGGYQVAWKFGGADQYTIWDTDSTGNYIPTHKITSGNAAAFQSAETTFGQDLNGDGTIGIKTTVIESAGVGTLSQVADTYLVNGQTLKYFGATITEGQFGAWTPIGAALSADGSQVAWQFGSANQYTIWDVDAAGNYVPGHTITSGTTAAFEAAELTFSQDLNGDGTIGIKTTVIEAVGSATLLKVADTYMIDGQALKYFGAATVEGQFGDWTPLGATRSGDGYQIAWKFGSTNQYTIWNLDSGRNYLPSHTITSGMTAAFQSAEWSFEQDLNGDGTVGVKTTVIDAVSTASLSKVADSYVIDGQVLTYFGTPVIEGQFGDWKPLGVVHWLGGYQITWKSGATDLYATWTLDSARNYVSAGAVMSGVSSALQSSETTYEQDLNGDGTIGVSTIVIEAAGDTTLSQVGDSYKIGSLTLKYNGSAVLAGQFGDWIALGVERSVGSYQVVWKLVGADQYAVWTVDDAGNYVPGHIIESGSELGAGYHEYLLQQDLNGDGRALQGTVIEAVGGTTLVKVADTYFLNPSSGGHGPQASRDGALIIAGGAPGTWVAVAAEGFLDNQIYQVAFHRVGTDSYMVKTLDASGAHYGPPHDTILSGASTELQSVEHTFGVDINGDGAIGDALTTVESEGDASLYLNRITNAYHIGAYDGPVFKIDGVAVTKDSPWQPVAVERNGFYQIMLKAKDLDQYQYGRADSAGNFIPSSPLDIMSGSSVTLKVWESAFQQDINGDGTIGIPPGVIESTGAAKLVKQSDGFYVYQADSPTGLQVKLANGAPVTMSNEFVPIGVDWTADSGFQLVLWSATGNVFRFQDLDSAGRYKTDLIGSVDASSMLLKTAEGLFQQDFNKDGTTGLPTTGAFDIDIHWTGDSGYRLFFQAAAARWEQIIIGDLPNANTAEYGTIDDLRIDVALDAIDGIGGTLAAAGWDMMGPSTLPVHGNIIIDSSDLNSMRSGQTLLSVIIHEIGHVLGIGTLWDALGLTESFGYVGEYGLEAYRQLSGNASAAYVPLETSGGEGTADAHWSDSLFGNELMTGFVSGPANPLSILTVAALRDLGYMVDTTKADAYTLPG